MKKIILIFLLSSFVLQVHASKINFPGNSHSLTKRGIGSFEGSFEFTRKNTFAVVLTNTSSPSTGDYNTAFTLDNPNNSIRLDSFTDDSSWGINLRNFGQSMLGDAINYPVKKIGYFDLTATNQRSYINGKGNKGCNGCKKDETGGFEFKLPSPSLLLLTNLNELSKDNLKNKDYLGALYSVGAENTPLPATAWLLISGVLGVVGLSSRKRQQF